MTIRPKARPRPGRFLTPLLALLLALALLAVAVRLFAHEVPSRVTVLAYLVPEGRTLHVVVRAPLEAMRDVELPLRAGPGEALDVARAAVEAAPGDAAAVVLGERSALARFAGHEVHQPTLVENLLVQLKVVDGQRVGVAVTNRTDPAALATLAQRAAEACGSAPPDPSFPGLAAPAALPEVGGYDEATAALAPEDQARLAAAAIGASPLGVYGYVTSGVTDVAVATTTGVAAEQTLTDATVLVLAADETRSGYATASSWRAGDLDAAAVAREAAAKAERTADARELEPGRYRAVLEPYAVAELLQYFAFHAFNGQALLEERSYVAGRIGSAIADTAVSIADDALDAGGFPKAFDAEGTPKQRVPLIERGVARGVVWDRAAAARAADGVESTGHALPPSLEAWGPFPIALAMDGGDAGSADELAELVGDGIYVTRLHYLGVVSPREGTLTGMTRDGTFRIRDGRIAEPLVNLRFTIAVPDLLAEVPALTRETRLVNQSDFYDERYPFGARVPALATTSFNVTGAGSRPGL